MWIGHIWQVCISTDTDPPDQNDNMHVAISALWCNVTVMTKGVERFKEEKQIMKLCPRVSYREEFGRGRLFVNMRKKHFTLSRPQN